MRKAWEWEWSSAGYHAGERKDSKIKLNDISEIIDLEKIDWKEYITDKEDPREINEIRKCTMLGRPWGGAEFVKTLSEMLGISLVYRKKGRPKKGK